uniref:Hypotheticial protein n=1 Tax=Schistosoma japonicum TaxID=6182 RepID=C1LKF3_SCHJA|nr:hypotheticial protein [Schistosoma japonicum]
MANVLHLFVDISSFCSSLIMLFLFFSDLSWVY